MPKFINIDKYGVCPKVCPKVCPTHFLTFKAARANPAIYPPFENRLNSDLNTK